MAERFMFSNCGQYLAHLNLSGLIRIWETDRNSLKQEFTLQSHLSSPCTSMIWLTVASNISKSKRRLSVRAGKQVSLLVLGADSGQVIYYSVAEAAIVLTCEEHTSRVSALAADVGTDLYSASDDLIVRWNISTNKSKRKWKTGKKSINSMAVSKDNKMLITATLSQILCWDVESRMVIRTFKGHNCEVLLLNIIEAPSGENYLVSAAKEDRIINAWNLSQDHLKTPVTMFRLTDTPTSISSNVIADGTITLAAVTRSGSLLIYSHQLNGVNNIPKKPTMSILVTSVKSEAASEKTVLIPILSVKASFKRLDICYGYSSFINFESIVLTSMESDMFLVRQDPRTTRHKNSEHKAGKVKSAEVDKNAEYLNPAVINRSLKREWDKIDSESCVTMESLLDKMNLSSKSQPTGDSMALMLVQGLNSQDKDILRNVLKMNKTEQITSTIQRLPVQAVMPLLRFLTTLVQSRTWMSQTAAEWLHALVRIHVGQLITDDSFGAVVAPLLGLVDTRLGCIGSMCKLRGRLDLLLDQITANGAHTKPLDVEPLLVYEDMDSPVNSNILEQESESSNAEDDDDDDDDDKDDDDDGGGGGGSDDEDDFI